MAEVEFRDGKHNIPDHLADLMIGMDTHAMTMEEAIGKANYRLVNDRLNGIQQNVVNQHFKDWSGR